MSSIITSLHRSLKVTPPDSDGLVQVTVSLPSQLLNDYISLLESLSGFVSAINHQKHADKLRSDSEETKKNFQFKQRHYKRLVNDYDRYISQGLSRTEAIKQLSADLRTENHPWRDADLVRSCLIDAGRPGRVGRPRRQK